MTILGKKDKLEVEWDEEYQAWKLSTRRDGKLLHYVIGKSVDGVIENGQLALEFQDIELIRITLVRVLEHLAKFRDGIPARYADAIVLWETLPVFAPWEWVEDFEKEVRAKFDRLREHPVLLYNGIEFHMKEMRRREGSLRDQKAEVADEYHNG